MTNLRDVMFPEIRRTPFAFENLAFALVFFFCGSQNCLQREGGGERREKTRMEECESPCIISLAQRSKAEQFCVCHDD